jgi:hypothetical protein
MFNLRFCLTFTYRLRLTQKNVIPIFPRLFPLSHYFRHGKIKMDGLRAGHNLKYTNVKTELPAKRGAGQLAAAQPRQMAAAQPRQMAAAQPRQMAAAQPRQMAAAPPNGIGILPIRMGEKRVI